MNTLLNASVSWHKSYEGQWQVFGTETATVDRIVEACKRLGNWHRHKDTILGQDLDVALARDVVRNVDCEEGDHRIIRACNALIKDAQRRQNVRWTSEFWTFVHAKDDRLWASPMANFQDAVDATTASWGLIAKPVPVIVSKDYCERQNWKGCLARAYVTDRAMNSAKDVIEHGRFIGYVEVRDRENDAHDVMSVVMVLIKAGVKPGTAEVDKLLTSALAILTECGYDEDESFDWFDEYMNDVDDHCIFLGGDGSACLGDRWPEEIRERQERRAERASA